MTKARQQPAIVFFSPHGQINGSFLDAVDAYLACRAYRIPARLLIVGLRRAMVLDMIRDRYGIVRSAWLDDIRCMLSRFSLRGWHAPMVLSSYGTFKRLGGWLRTDKWLVLPSFLLRGDAAAGRIRERPESCFLLDPGRHDYPVAWRADYRKKMYLDGLRAPPNTESAYLINCVSSHKAHTATQIRNALPEGIDRTAVRILSYQRRDYERAGFQVLIPPVHDLFGRFRHYLYLASLTGYDENPRMLVESAWLGKEVHYFGNGSSDDGALHAWRRVVEDISSFRLRRDDLICRAFAGEWQPA
jgi:hypothetical protein